MQVFAHHLDAGVIRPTAVTVGSFDGVHVGHRALLARLLEVAGDELTPTVMTLDPHPLRVVAPERAPPLVCTREDQAALLSAAGVRAHLAQRFDADFASLSPERFVRDVLVGSLGARHVVVGHDFRFGARGAGDCATLLELGARLGFRVDEVDAVEVDGAPASSTRIRAAIEAGEMESAARLLGRPFHLFGPVGAGAGRGAGIGFPTANIEATGELRPPHGVYAGWLDWGEGPMRAVTNIGVTPTFGGRDAPTVEAHVIDHPGLNLYGRRARLFLVSRLRPERRFESVDALRAQITADRDASARLLETAPLPSWP